MTTSQYNSVSLIAAPTATVLASHGLDVADRGNLGGPSILGSLQWMATATPTKSSNGTVPCTMPSMPNSVWTGCPSCWAVTIAWV